MAFIPGYDYDICISFSPVDNGILPTRKNGWIEQFYKDLNLMLAKRIGCLDVIKCYWDNKKRDNSLSSDKSTETGIQKSAILICINSDSYIASSTCRQELETFYKKAKAGKSGLQVGDQPRIIHVLLNNVPVDKWPVELNSTVGFHFHHANEAGVSGNTVDPLSEEYKSQMQKLGDAVWKLLNDFPREQTAGSVQHNIIPAEKEKAFTIYMSEVADTLRSTRKRIITELNSKGYNVLMGIPPPEESAAHEKATMEALKNADMTIHLLDELPGREITGEPNKWYPQKQTELSLKSGKPQMIWVPEETDYANIEEVKYKQFLFALEKGYAAAKGYEFVRGPKCTLTQDIIDFAEHVKAKESQKKDSNGVVSVMLDTHYNDQQYAIDLGRILLENQIQPLINPQEDDPRKNIHLMGERLSQVNKLIFIYGTVSKEWVRERMCAALELIITNNYPIEDFIIYMAPPFKEESNIFIKQKFLRVNVINNSKNAMMNKDDLKIFLNALKTKAE